MATNCPKNPSVDGNESLIPSKEEEIQQARSRPAEGMEDEPPTKKSRAEDSLLPEQEFLLKHKGPVTIKVQVPTLSDKPEWRLNGQTLNLVLALTDSFSAVKSRIQDETGLPPAKQKLQHEGMFYKDSNTLGFYNMLSGSVVQLQLKKRGGRHINRVRRQD